MTREELPDKYVGKHLVKPGTIIDIGNTIRDCRTKAAKVRAIENALKIWNCRISGGRYQYALMLLAEFEKCV